MSGKFSRTLPRRRDINPCGEPVGTVSRSEASRLWITVQPHHPRYPALALFNRAKKLLLGFDIRKK
jgi:hypothetical protein